MHKKRILLFAALLLVACTDPYRRIYEGARSNADAKRTPAERATAPSAPYDAYRKEREGAAEK